MWKHLHLATRHVTRCLTLSSFFALVLFTTSSEATKHTFTAHKDERLLIGPIGAPYGFLSDGIYNLTVYDFELHVKEFDNKKKGTHADGKKEKKKKKKDKITRKEKEDEEDKENEDEDDDGEETPKIVAGFLLQRFESESDFARYYEYLSEKTFRVCSWSEEDDHDDNIVLGKDVVEISLSMEDESTWDSNPSRSHTFTTSQEGLYVLFYQVCVIPSPHSSSDDETERKTYSDKEVMKVLKNHEIWSTFELDLSMHNVDSSGQITYLTAGEMPLPTLFFICSIFHGVLIVIWIQQLRKSQQVQQVHYMMALLLIFKFLSLVAESVRYHYIHLYGHTEFWSTVYYTFAFLKGIMLFITILLIGSGWSFLKPFLNPREKKLVFIVLLLQILDNLALITVARGTEGERLYDDWIAVLHLFDVVCCILVLVPIVWQVNNLENSVNQMSSAADADEDEAMMATQNNDSQRKQRAATKLKLFRSFYLSVVAYIYFTRIIVYLLASGLEFHFFWVQNLVTELATLAFYILTGYKFRPRQENPYFELKKEDYGEGEVELFVNQNRKNAMSENDV